MGHDETVSAAFDAELAACSALARGLTQEQWRAPSLCDEWTVRDVVAHLAFHTHRAGFAETLRAIVTPQAKYMSGLIAREHRDTIEGLVAWLASPAPAAARGSIVNLCELVIHQQDVRRPLGVRRAYPEATMRMCLEHCTTLGGATLVVGNVRRAGHRLRLVATDITWSHGDGPEVTGPSEALVMAIARRPAALADLSGAGVSILAERLGVPVPAAAVPASLHPRNQLP